MVKIVGIRNVHYTGKDGQPRDGVELHYTEPRDGVQGEATGSIYLPASRAAELSFRPAVGDACELVYRPGYGGRAVVADIREI